MTHPEMVVLLDEQANEIGTAPKATVHDTNTPLHLAFSCHAFNEQNELLLTRRALSKKTWPGVWTNSFCGHPAPGEDRQAAVRRRGRHELGMEIVELTLALPHFRYRAVDASGTVENEVCPVYRATVTGEPSPRPDEVAEWAWVSPGALQRATAAAPFAFSPWLVEQVPLLWTDNPTAPDRALA